MLSIKKLACPSCNVKLRVAESLPPGKMITCPKCNEKFTVPPASEIYQSSEATAQPRKPAPRREEDEDPEEEVTKRPRPRKRSKKAPKEASNGPLLLGLGIGGGVALAAGIIVAIFVLQKKPEPIAQNASSRPTVMQPRPGPGPGPAEAPPADEKIAVRSTPPRPEQNEPPPESGPGLSAQRPVSTPAPPTRSQASSDADLIAAGQTVFQANRCGRCHGVGDAPGRGGRRGGRGPSLARVGAMRSVDWLMEQIRDPQSHKPDSRMPPSPNISEPDLRALAMYLASLK